MKDFPDIKPGQIALLWADSNTGIVLDKNFNTAFDNIQSAYIIFNSENEAMEYAKQTFKTRNNVECIIYTHDKKVVHILESDNNNAWTKRV
jgi:hypothetical protein